MRVGISILTQQGQVSSNSPLPQNAWFLANSLRHTPLVRSLVFIEIGDQGSQPSGIQYHFLDIPVLRPDQAADHVDVVIELAQGLDVSWLDYLRARGKKVVGYIATQAYCEWVEPTVFDRLGYVARPDRYDAVWVVPQAQSLMQMLRALHRCPCQSAPFLWSPLFLEQRIAGFRQQGLQFGYVPRGLDEQGRRPGLRPVIAELNNSVSRACTIPMLACEEAYRAEPLSIEMMSVLHSLHMKSHETLLHLVHSLSLFRERKAALLGLHDTVGLLAQQANAVVSHQWMHEQSYTDLEALYGNYPLVHNANWIQDIGYYYPAFDCQQAGRQLLQAHHFHDEQLLVQSQKVHTLLKRIDPLATSNVQAHADLLRAVVESAT